MSLCLAELGRQLFVQLQIILAVSMAELLRPCGEGSYVVITVHLVCCRLRGMPGWLLVGQVASKSGKCCLTHLDNLH